jgi:hypothetical protein
MRKTLSIALAGLTLVTAAPASAQATSPYLQRAVQTSNDAAADVQKVQYYGDRYYRGRGYDRGYYGRRHYGPRYRGYYRDGYYDRGYYDRRYYGRRDRSGDALAAGVIGFALGAAVASANQPRGYSSHCYRYRSFDPRTGTFVGYDGRVRYCR